eukprot:snap_masked-scaffold_68-processed-gene-0.48-mRNA-1 protein AED:1.00 eAED:1.00 QI:0/-1/0/0/-1/1/1/0/231
MQMLRKSCRKLSTLAHRKIAVTQRFGDGKQVAKKLKKQGLLPGILYGKELEKEFHRGALITTKKATIEKELRENMFTFENTVYEIEYTNEETGRSFSQLAVPRDLQVHARTLEPIHCSFLSFNPERGVKVEIPINYLDADKSAAMRRGAYLNEQFQKLKCLVQGNRIPQFLDISLEGKNIGDRLELSDIRFPDDVQITPILPLGVRKQKTIVISKVAGKKSVKRALNIEAE